MTFDQMCLQSIAATDALTTLCSQPSEPSQSSAFDSAIDARKKSFGLDFAIAGKTHYFLKDFRSRAEINE